MNKNVIMFLTALTVLFLSAVPNRAFANECVNTITNPAAASEMEIHAYGVPRQPGRNHHGVDIMLPMCLPVQNQTGCKIILNPENDSPLWRQGGETTGYGLVMRYKCGPRVEVRYAHLNGYNANSRMAINGKSGASRATDPHIHYEVVVYSINKNDGIKVDPQCVWGNHPQQSECCKNVYGPCTLGVSPIDMCDDNRLNDLRSNARSSRTQGLNPTNSTYMNTFNNGNIVNPEDIPAGQYAEDLPGCVDPTPPEDRVPINESPEGEEVGVISDVGTGLLPGTGVTGRPPVPVSPLPPIPGTPGGAPNLVPPPTPTSSLSPSNAKRSMPVYSARATPLPSNNTSIPLSGCAADTWTAMVNQAVMETRREDLLNKRFIVKPDSVLDYSCFSEQYKILAERAGPIFSESNKWDALDVDVFGEEMVTVELQTLNEDNDPFFSEKDYEFWRDYTDSSGQINPYELMSPTSLDMALDDVIAKAAKAYIENNFRYGTQDFLAGSSPVSGISSTNCNIMDAVWKAAQCKHFDGSDIFYSFEDLVNTDPRQFPASMICL